MALHLSAAAARRFLAMRHLLAPPRSLPGTPGGVLAAVDRLGSVQFDPLSVAGRNHDLVLHARVEGYRRELTDELLYGRRLLFETNNKGLSLLPASQLPWFRVRWARAAAGAAGRLLTNQKALTARILAQIEERGPQSSADFDREARIEWFWGPTSAVRAVLEALNAVGTLGLARRDGNRRHFDLTERLFPADLLATRIPERDQLRHTLLSRFRGHGLLGAAGSSELWLGIGKAPLRTELRRELLERGQLTGVLVEGLRGERFVITDELPILAEAARQVDSTGATGTESVARECAFLAPLDPLLWDRRLSEPLYGFDYRWEVYVPAAKRRWGYYVLPIVFGDRLVGRIEPRIERRMGAVRLLCLGFEAGFGPLEEPGFVEALARALHAYLGFAGVSVLEAAPNVLDEALFGVLAACLPLRRPG